MATNTSSAAPVLSSGQPKPHDEVNTSSAAPVPLSSPPKPHDEVNTSSAPSQQKPHDEINISSAAATSTCPPESAGYVAMLLRDLFDKDEHRIYRVPERIRNGNEEFYRPRVVSIGPYHYKSLSSGNTKLLYAENFFSRHAFQTNLEEIKSELEKIAGTCYSKSIEQTTEDFAAMMIVEGAFLLELMLRSCVPNYRRDNDSDPIFHGKRILLDVYRDILLIENQLPLSVLQELCETYNAYPSADKQDHLSLARLAVDFFNLYLGDNIGNGVLTNLTDKEFLSNVHLAAFVRSFYSPSRKSTPSSSSSDGESKHNVKDSNTTFESIPPSVTALYEAGVRFEKLNPASDGLKIKFDTESRSLKIPVLNYRTGTLLLNLMGFEELGNFPSGGNYVSQYMFFMGCMIRTSKDVDLLIESGIISSMLGSNRDLAALRISKMGWPHDYFTLSDQLNGYCKKTPWHKWTATLKRDYFDTPWKIASTIAAVILLILTIMQTVLSFLSLKY